MRDGDTQVGLLTPDQRELLTTGGRQDVTARAKRAMRARIRERIRAGLSDFSTIRQHMELDELLKVFEEPKDVDYDVLPTAITDNLAVLILGIDKLGDEVEFISEPEPEFGLEGYLSAHLEWAIEQAMNKKGIATTNVTVEVAIDSEEIGALAKDLSEQPDEVLMQLHRAGEITTEEFIQAVREREQAEE